MEVHQVRYFLAVCETLNFTRAAENCNVSQPALTRAVHKLEEELGGLLLRRENNLTHLTDFGRLVRPHLEQMMAEAQAAKSTAKHFLQMDNAPINLGVMCSVGPIRFMSFLAEFHATHPGCDMTLVEGAPERLAELLLGWRARSRGDGSAGSLQPPARGSRTLSRAVLRRIPDGASFSREEPGPRYRCRR
jgi:DNA-binding transcriptional LysR family regulator